MNIEELIAKHSKIPGDIVVRKAHWNWETFRPYYFLYGQWYGIRFINGGTCSQYYPNDGTWLLCTGEKKTIKRWLWSSKDGCIDTSLSAEGNPIYNIRLDWSETEFEEYL